MDNNTFKKFISENYGDNISYDGEFISLRKTPRLIFHCNKECHNEPFSLRVDWVLKRKVKTICPFCNGKYNTEIINRKLNEMFNGNISMVSTWNYSKDNSVKTDIIFNCKYHGDFTEKLNNVLNYKLGCSKCAYQLSNKLKHQKPINDLKNLLDPKGIIFNVDEYVNVNTPINFYKITNGEQIFIFKRSPGKILYDGLMDINHTSTGELFIKSTLDDNNIEYQQQYSFPDLKYKRPLKFDFFIEKYNILIEYDGSQHYNMDSLFYDNEAIIRDTLKDNYVKSNNLRLLRIIKLDNHRLSKNKKILVTNKIKDFLKSSTTIETFEI